MLNTGPWNRLPLSVRWLRPDLKEDADFIKQPPIHMPVLYGQVKSVKLKAVKSSSTNEEQRSRSSSSTPLLCGLCFENVPSEDQVGCLSPKCGSIYHLFCLSDNFRSKSEHKSFLPIDGHCPLCEVFTLWGDVIRKKKGCYNLDDNKADDDVIS